MIGARKNPWLFRAPSSRESTIGVPRFGTAQRSVAILDRRLQGAFDYERESVEAHRAPRYCHKKDWRLASANSWEWEHDLSVSVRLPYTSGCGTAWGKEVGRGGLFFQTGTPEELFKAFDTLTVKKHTITMS